MASVADIPSCLLSKAENCHTSLVPKKSTNKTDRSGPIPLLRARVSTSIHRSTWSRRSGEVVLYTMLSTTAPTKPREGFVGANESHETRIRRQKFEAQVEGTVFSRADGMALDSSPKMTMCWGSRPIANHSLKSGIKKTDTSTYPECLGWWLTLSVLDSQRIPAKIPKYNEKKGETETNVRLHLQGLTC